MQAKKKSKALSSRDLKAIKEGSGIDLYQFSMNAAMSDDAKLVPDQSMIEAVCAHSGLENWQDVPFSDCINHAMEVLADTFGGKAEKK
jgi:hypothetical protein